MTAFSPSPTSKRHAALNAVVHGSLLLLVVLPVLCLNPAALDPFKSNPELVITVLAWVATVAIALVTPWRPRPLTWGLLTLLAWVGVTCAVAFQPAAAWRYGGLVATYGIFGLSLLAWVDGHVQRRAYVLALVLGSLAFQGLVALAQIQHVSALALAPPTGPMRDWARMVEAGALKGSPIGTLGHVNYLGEWLALTGPVAIAWLSHLAGRRRWVAVLVAVAAGFLLWRADTRSAWLGLLAALPLAAAVVWRPRWAWAVGAGGVVAAAIAYPLLGRVLSEPTVLLRFASWRAAWDLWCQHPLTGVGLGGFKLLSVSAIQAANAGGVPETLALERLLQAHNEPLQLLAEIGAVGALLVAGLLGGWVSTVARNGSWPPALRFGFLSGVGALALSACFGFPLHVPFTALMLVFVLAIGAAGAEAPAVARGRWPMAVAFGLLGLWIVLGDAWPQYRGQLAAYEGNRHRLAGQWLEAEAAYARADAGLRFKGRLRWYRLQALVEQGKHAEAASLFDASAKEGLGVDAHYWHGRALEGLNRPDEALAAYQRVTAFFPEGRPLHAAAKERIAGLQ